MQGMNSYSVFEGKAIRDNVQISPEGAMFMIPGENGAIPVSETMLSKHMLLLGGIGSGKTNVFNHLVRNIRASVTGNDVIVIFDPKGDYYDRFYQPGDVVISNDARATHYWNIFEEVLIDQRVEENVLEISNFLFKDKIEGSSNPFFPSAARDVFSSLLLYTIRQKAYSCMNNRALRRNADSKNASDYIRFFSRYSDMRGVCAYIADDAKGQTQGVMSEFQQTVREIFVGNFREKGDFSIRRAVREKGGKAIFIEYDLGLGRTLAPIYGLHIDLAIKEALCRSENEGNVYFIMDEFRLMSKLEHMDNGINFGRSLGAKFILGLQNVDQVYDVYGEYAARSILSGCMTLFGFSVNDKNSRDLIKERAGENIRKVSYMSVIQSKGINEMIINGSAIEDWDIGNLPVGHAIVQSGNCQPFLFNFRLFQ